MTFDKEQAYEIYEEEKGIAKAARDYCEKIGIEYEERYRHQLSRYISSLNQDAVGGESEPKAAKTLPFSAIDENGKFMNEQQTCEKYNLPYNKLKKANLITHNSKITWNMEFAYSVEEPQLDTDFFEDVVKDLCELQKYDVKPVADTETADRVIISDLHVGMETSGNINTIPVYDDPWNADVLENRRQEMCEYILKKRRSSILYIDDLGDGADGVGGHTSRGGHKLPQNMNDRDIFKTLLYFRIKVLDQLVPHYERIVCNLVMDSNHGPKLDQIVGEAVKLIASCKYDNVKIVLHDRFISHYVVGKNTFILCHGKDAYENKFGMKPILDHKVQRKIDEYCQFHNLINGNTIEFSKGDSHQAIFDHSTSKNYSYMSYPCFATNSNWAKMNFQNGNSGFAFQTFNLDGRDRSQSLYYFK